MDRFTTTATERHQGFLAQRMRDTYLMRAKYLDEEEVPATFDILTWLAEQRQAGVPASDTWGWTGSGGIRRRMADQIDKLVADSFQPLTIADQDRLGKPNARDGGDWTHLLKVLKKGGAKIYDYHEGIIVGLPYAAFALDFVNQGGVDLRHARGSDYLGVLVRTWSQGSRSAHRAREFLCNLLRRDIHEATQQAGRDFQEAIAISNDGRRIVQADEVVVYTGKKWITLPVNRFHDNKILLSDRYGRLNVSQPLGRFDEACRTALKAFKLQRKGPFVLPARPYEGQKEPRYCDQVFVSYKDRGLHQGVFVTTLEYCPDPLPDPGFQKVFEVA